MTTTPSGLTNEMIRNKAIYDSIDFYLKEGETKDALMKQFGSNLIKLIQYLRSRDNIPPVEKAPIKPSAVKKPEAVIPAMKKESKKKATSPAKNQSGLF